MSELEIRTRDNKTDFLPGEELAGEVSWQTDSAPGPVELRLFWHTEGKGTRDVEVIESISFNVPAPQDRRDFRFQLPDSPYSFSGKLISVVWALELVLPSTGETERLEIVISPTREEIALQHD
jgi:hypothetical protein